MFFFVGDIEFPDRGQKKEEADANKRNKD